MANPDVSKTVPFTDVTSDFLKLVNIPDNVKPTLIDFTATDFASLREALISYIRVVYPTDYQNFVESDLGTMLVELVAYMGAVLSMKADMLAHENFIHTAKDRGSIRKLFELIGISLKGPTSAQAEINLSMDGQTGSLTDILSLPVASRVISVTSPEDREPLTYTIYKSVNGIVDPLNSSNATISFDQTNWAGDSSSVWTGVMLEGAFATQEGQFSKVGTNQNISLEEAPVVQNSVQVFVSALGNTAEGSYRQVENIFQASSTLDRIFQVVYTDDYNAKVIFGDGNTGIAPPPNADYFITYRVGGGSRGNTPDNFINALITGATYNSSPSSVRVTQKQIATGGAGAETAAHAKKYGPLTFKRQDRLVSLDDYVSFASRYVSPAGTVGKATASTRQAFSSANIIDLFILEKATDTQLQKASLSFKSGLLTAMDPIKMITDEVIVSDGLIRTLDLIVTVHLDEALQGIENGITAKVSQSIQEYFLSDKVDFGDPVIFADLNRVIFETPEVRFSSIDNFSGDIFVDFNEVVQLNNLIVNVNWV